MSNMLTFPDNPDKDGSNSVNRRGLLRGAAALMTTAALSTKAMSSEAMPRDYSPGAAPQRYPDPDVVVINPKRFKAKVGNTSIKRLYTGCLWAEGPAWNAQGQFLIFSDIPTNRQLRYLDDDGHISEQFRKPTNEANGNTFDFEGRQITCERTRIVRFEHDGSTTVLAEQANGKPLNGPNDLVVHPNDKSIWFTDPGYGAIVLYEDGRTSNGSLQPFQKEAVYRVDALTGQITRLPTIRSSRTASPSATTTRRSISATAAARITPKPRTSSGSTISMATSSPIRARCSTWRWTEKVGLSRRHARRYRGQYLGRRRLGRRRLRRRPGLCAGRRTHRHIRLPETAPTYASVAASVPPVHDASQSLYAVYVETQGAHNC